MSEITPVAAQEPAPAAEQPLPESAAAAPPPVEGAEAAEAAEAAASDEAAPKEGGRRGRSEGRRDRRPEGDNAEAQPTVNLAPEFTALVRLATKYAEIGPPVAELAFKVGYGDFGRQILAVALGGNAPGLEYFAVAARQAKHEGNNPETLNLIIAALRGVAAAPESYNDPDDVPKLLHLVRLGFTVLLFELKDPNGAPDFIAALASELPKLSQKLATDPFYHSLMAQTLWYADKEASERAWDQAAELGEPEFTHNARGTWYKEAEHDAHKAERAYRQGIAKAPHSPLLRHNLAQLLLMRAQANRDKDEIAWPLIQEADGLVRGALQSDCPKGLRRHIHATRGDIAALRNELRPRSGEHRYERPERGERQERPERSDRPERSERHDRVDEAKLAALEVGQTVKGKVKSLATYGAFVALDGNIVGLLHKSEIAYEHIADPAQILQIGQEVEVKVVELNKQEPQRPRIGLSRKALLPAPAPRNRNNDNRGPDNRDNRDNRGPRNNNNNRNDNRPPQQQQQQRDHRGPDNRDNRDQRGPDNRDSRDNQRPADSRRDDRREGPKGGPGPGPKGEQPGSFKFPSLGEMLLAKLREQESKG